MMIHRHPSFLPAVLVLLTIGLGAWMFWSFRAPAVAPAPVSAASEAGYRTALRQAVGPVLDSAARDRAARVGKALSDVLALRVPADDMSIHLAFARALSRLSDGYKGDAAALQDGQDLLDAAVAANPWVR